MSYFCESDEGMCTTSSESSSSSGLEDVDQPKIKRARADSDGFQEADDFDGSPEQAETEPGANFEETRSTRARKLKDPKEEPVNPLESDENRPPQDAVPKQKTTGRKRENPRATEPAFPSTSGSETDRLESTTLSSPEEELFQTSSVDAYSFAEYYDPTLFPRQTMAIENEEWWTSISPVHEDTPWFDKSSRKLMEKIDGFRFVHNRELSAKVLRSVTELCGGSRFLPGFPGKLPVDLTAKNVPDFGVAPYMVSFKSHCMRFLMFLVESGETYLLDEDNNVFSTSLLTFPHQNDPKNQIGPMVLDGDMVAETKNRKKTPRFLVRDVALATTVRSMNFADRRKWVLEAIIKVRAAAVKRGEIKGEPVDILLKDFFGMDLAEELLGEKFRETVPHRIDGLQLHSVRLSPDSIEQFFEWDEATSGDPGALSAERLLLAIRRRNGAKRETITMQESSTRSVDILR